MQIDFYTNFYKKENSTKRPSTGSGSLVGVETVTGHLKEPCSVLHPVISLQKSPNVSYPPDFFRYAYIPLFSRYYWVDDWSWEDGLWTVHLDVDVLATYRTDIGEQTEYILRTDSTNNPLNYDGAISDAMYPATTNFSIDKIPLQNPFETAVADGTYVLGVISKDDTNAVGAITYWAMTSAEFGDLKDMLFSDNGLESMDLWDSVDGWLGEDMAENTFKTMYNPYQYIVSCMWFPVSKSNMTGTQETTMDIGWWNYNIAGKRLSSTTHLFNDGVQQLPVHPQASTRGKYLNYAPYTKYTLHGKFGSIPLDTSYFEIGDYLVNTYTVDYVTGQCLYEVFVADNALGTNRSLITKTEFLIGVPIQLAQIGRDYLGMAVNAVGIGTGAVSGAMTGLASGTGVGGAIVGALAGASGAIYDTVSASMPQLQTSGVNGSFITSVLSTVLIAIHYVTVDEDIHHRGRPLCKLKRIDTLSGYILCAEGDINLNAYDSERTEVKKFLTTGFFWE